jgi:hypothetical protein
VKQNHQFLIDQAVSVSELDEDLQAIRQGVNSLQISVHRYRKMTNKTNNVDYNHQ